MRSRPGRFATLCGVIHYLTLPLVALCVSVSGLPAQMRTARNVHTSYLADSARGGVLVLKPRAFVEIQRGYQSAYGEQAWGVRVSGVVDLLRLSENIAVALDAGIEMTANRYNVTGFNPRGLFLDPTLTIAYRAHAVEWHASVFHRCRHDIDNIDPPNSLLAEIDTTRVRREIVLAGLQVGALTRQMALPHGIRARLWGTAESYTVRLEGKGLTVGTPFNSTELLAGFTAGGTAVLPMTARSALYARGFTNLVVYRTASGGAHLGGRFEPGIRVRGSHGAVDMFVATERAFDDYSSRGPKRATMFAVGMRIGEHSFF